MENAKSKMSIYITVLLWIVIPVLILNIVTLVFSNGDTLGVALVGLYSLMFVCWGIFLAYSFLLGYKAGEGALIAIPVLLLIAGVFLWQSSGSWIEPGTLWRQFLSGAVLFGVLLFAGLLCQYGVKTGGFMHFGTILVSVVIGFICIVICLSRMCGAYSPLPEELFWKDAYPETIKNGTVLFHDAKIYINPFDSRVIGVFRFNDKGEYVGFSSSRYECHKIVNSAFKVNDEIKASTCDFVYTGYEPLLNDFMADCRDALYVKEKDYCVFLYTKEGFLYRKEFDYHSNGIVKQARSYTYDRETGFHIEEGKTIEFDELGFCENNGLLRWDINDFRQTDTVIAAERRYGQVYNPTVTDKKYTVSQQAIIDSFITVESRTGNAGTLKKYSSLDVPLDEYYKLGTVNGHVISVHINTDSYKWRNRGLHGFTQLKTVDQMYTFIDALELSSLDTGMWKRIGKQSLVVGDDDECYSFMIKENAKGGKALVLYILGDYAVTADSRFSFHLNPYAHKDVELQKKAGEAWDKMMNIFTEYKEKEN